MKISQKTMMNNNAIISTSPLTNYILNCNTICSLKKQKTLNYALAFSLPYLLISCFSFFLPNVLEQNVLKKKRNRKTDYNSRMNVVIHYTSDY